MSATSIDRLVRMANQIALNLTVPGRDGAVDATAAHITAFWDPRMKRMIHDHLAAGGEGLSDVARAALAKVAVPAL